MREEIRSLQQRLGITTVFVTHDQAEALAVSDNVIVMDGGHVVESGIPQQIYAWPRKAFTARFLGVSNMFRGEVVELSAEAATVRTGQGLVACRLQPGIEVGHRVEVFVRPESFRLSRSRHTERAWAGIVRFSIYHGDAWDYHIEVGGETVKVRAYREKIGLEHGDTVFLELDEDSAILVQEGPGAGEDDDQVPALGGGLDGSASEVGLG